MATYNKITTPKVRILSRASCFVFACIIVKLLYLQINLTPHFVARSKQNFLRIEVVPSLRGNIVDACGNLLATNRPVINIYWQGTGNLKLTDAQTDILEKISSIVTLPLHTNPNMLHNIAYTERQYKDIRIATDITIEQLSKIEELFPNHPNLVLKTDFKRIYPYKECASHLVGYLSNTIDSAHKGQMGIEKIFEDALKGTDGQLLNTINSFGRKLHHTQTHATASGQDIVTTINITLQQLCEEVFPECYSGTFIIMDPEDGAIKALVSRPNFDPNIFLQPISTDRWQELQEKKPFLNRALNSAYPPGSLFKLVTVSAALEHGIISQESTCICNGHAHFGNRKYNCNNQDGHGCLTAMQALAHSCNILCFDIAKKIDIDLLATYAHMFGLGNKTNILLPESAGLVPTKEWKKNVKGQRWWTGETLSASIGQSFLKVTPIQVACMISSIFTGKRPKPRILHHEDIEHERLHLRPETLDFLQKSMKRVVNEGTGQRVGRLKNFEIYAKTSTAQTSDLTKRTLGTQYMEHGWFALHFSYKNGRPLTAVILVENAGSSRIATEIAKNFLIQYAHLIEKS